MYEQFDPVAPAINAEDLELEHNGLHEHIFSSSDPEVRDGNDLFFKHIRNTPLLTTEQERMLGQRIQAGDRGALRELVEANFGLVVSIAKNNKGNKENYLPFMDRVQNGMLGLIRAAEMFNPELGFKFSTYAYNWISVYITREGKNTGRVIRLPVHVHDNIQNYKRKYEEHLKAFGEEPTDGQMASAVGLKISELVLMKEAMQSIDSIDRPITDDGVILADLHAANEADPSDIVIEELGRQQRKTQLAKAMGEVLTEDAIRLLTQRYGLNGQEPKTLADISRTTKKPAETIKRRHNNALNRIRAHDGVQALRDS